MDRVKSGTGRGSKSKTPLFPADLYALGPKRARNEANDSKKPLPVPINPAPSSSVAERKRFAAVSNQPSTSTVVQPAKKPKLISNALTRPTETVATVAPLDTSRSWELVAVDVESVNLIPMVQAAIDLDDNDTVTAVLCGAFKLLKGVKFKPDQILVLGLLYLAKKWPSIFVEKTVFNALCSVLKRESQTLCKTKITVVNVVLITNILYHIYRDDKKWPEILMKMYVDDAVGQRIWVDNPRCKCLVDNVIAGANTIPSPRLDLDYGTVFDSDDDTIDISEPRDYEVFPRYEESEIMNMINKTTRDQQGISSNFLKFLSSMCGIVKVRAEAAPKLESCFINLKLKRSAQELLMSICMNCNTNSEEDREIVSQIVRIRLKSKDMSGFFLECIKKLLRAHRKNALTALKQIINNELSAVRNPINMPMIVLLFQSEPKQFAVILAKMYLKCLINREDNLRFLRCFLREIHKTLKIECLSRKEKQEFDLQVFIDGLMYQSKHEPKDSLCKEQVFNSVVDLITLCIFLIVFPLVRLEKKDRDEVTKIRTTVANIQSYTLRWFYKNANSYYKPSPNDLVHAIRKVVFLEPADQYYKVDNWPEQDRTVFMRHVTEVPVLQDTVLTILAIGLSKGYPVTSVESLDIVEQLVKRASTLVFTLDVPVLQADKLELIDMLFNLSTYRWPKNTELPANYTPPVLAISNLYWKSWIILLFYCAHVPDVFGALAWNKYPTLRVLIEMCITNHFVFVQAADDLQFLALEKQKILEFETYLASNTITESSSLLLAQLITLDPMGAARKPPGVVLNQLKQLNASHKIGHLLCRSRNPDFLSDIIKKQGPSQAMPWLADLVQNDGGSFDHLPVQCLCEFLLCSKETFEVKYQQLLRYLQVLLTDENRSPSVVSEILEHFLRRLRSQVHKEQAVSAMKVLLSKFGEDEMEVDRLQSKREEILWILSKLPKLPHFQAVKSQIIFTLREACLVENDPELITCYLTFLAQHAASNSNSKLEDLTLLTSDMAQLIVQRSIITSAILRSSDETDVFRDAALKSLLKIFYVYMNKARDRNNVPVILGTENPGEILLVTWPSGEQAVLYAPVIHAVIILLTYNNNTNVGNSERHYSALMNMWFPDSSMPKAYSVNEISKGEGKEVSFIPKWLKKRMIRSGIGRLVENALIDLEPGDLVSFGRKWYFGASKTTRKRFLKSLDDAISENDVSSSDLDVDKRFMTMAEFVIQHRREVNGINVLAKTIKALDLDISTPEVPVSNVDLTNDDVEFTDEEETRLSDRQIEAIVENMHVNWKSTELTADMKEQRQKLLRILPTEAKCGSKSFSVIVQTLQKRIKNANYVNGLVNNFQYPSHVFRLITTSCRKENSKSLMTISRSILNHEAAAEKPKNPLLVTLRVFLNKFQSSASKPTKKNEKDSAQVFETCTVDQLETYDEELIDEETKKTKNEESVIERVTRLLSRADGKFANSIGLFIDEWVRVEPEIIGSSLETQLDMLFCVKSNVKWASAQKCRPYLLTLLTHHASWTTLERALSSLLVLESTERYDASAVLDFLWALARNPRLWQGREKRTPKHQRPTDVLSLTEEQLICVIKYIVLEVESYGCNETGLSRMSNRLSQLIQCAIEPNNSKILVSIIGYLNETSKLSEIRQTICHNVIAHLYLRIPRIITLLGELQQSIKFEGISKADRDSSVFDSMSHTVLTSFTCETQSKDWPGRSQDLELIIRKMASAHPRLLLRQIRILETSLRGRAHLEWSIFYSRNHLLLFQRVIGFLELLQPHLFSAEFNQSLHSVFDSYLNLFKNHVGKTEVAALMNRFAAILRNFIRNDAKLATVFLRSRSTALRELGADYPCINHLCIPTCGLGGNKEIIAASSAPEEIDPHQWNTIIKSFKRNVLDPSSVLRELDYASSRKPELVESALDFVRPSVYDAKSYNRSKAFKLLMRCVQHNPSTASRIMPHIFNCLYSNNLDIVEDACKILPELVVCSQENALPVVCRLFEMVVREGVDTLACIKRTIALLNLQSSC